MFCVRIDTLKQNDVSKVHIPCQLKHEVDLIKQSTSGTVFCSYTGQVTHDTSITESASNQPAFIGHMDISIFKLNEWQRQKLFSCFNIGYLSAKQEMACLYLQVIRLTRHVGGLFSIFMMMW